MSKKDRLRRLERKEERARAVRVFFQAQDNPALYYESEELSAAEGEPFTSEQLAELAETITVIRVNYEKHQYTP